VSGLIPAPVGIQKGNETMSTIDRNLTSAQKATIENVFTRHKIKIEEQRFQFMFKRIEQAWAVWEHCKKYAGEGIIGRTKMLSEIERLRYALKSLNPSTRNALSSCCYVTPTMKQLEKTPELRKSLQQFQQIIMDNWSGDEPEIWSLADIAFYILIEACDEAIERGGPSPFAGRTAVDDYTKKAGRPTNNADLDLVRDIGHSYRVATGKNPAETPNGPFDDFLSAVFNVIDPRRDKTSFRKLIRHALGGASPHWLDSF
jgi:hypothetical protein